MAGDTPPLDHKQLRGFEQSISITRLQAHSANATRRVPVQEGPKALSPIVKSSMVLGLCLLLVSSVVILAYPPAYRLVFGNGNKSGSTNPSPSPFSDAALDDAVGTDLVVFTGALHTSLVIFLIPIIY